MNLQHCWHQSDFPSVKTMDFCGGTLAYFTHRSPDKESPNEDSAGAIQISPHHGVIVVADGVGGANAGAMASHCAVQKIVQSIEHATQTASDVAETERSTIVDAIENANHEILTWKQGAATTVCAVEILNQNLRTFHVGDSSILQFSNQGTLKFYSVAHAPIAMAVESGMLDEADALLHEDRNLINNCVGCPEMKIEIGPNLSLAKRDTVVLASDALLDNFTMNEVVQVLRWGDLHKQSQKMIDMTMARMRDTQTLPCKPDDLTMLCFRPC